MEFDIGVYTVIPSIFKESDVHELNLDEILNLINFQIDSGIKNIVLLGTTSETPTLTDEEQDLIVKSVWEKFNGKVQIIVGIGGNNSRKTVENGIKYFSFCDAFMVTVPYYNKPSQNGILKHFEYIAEYFEDKPLMLYNVPSRCGVSMSAEVVANLFYKYSNVKAIKEASGSLSLAQEIINLCDITVLSGDDSNTLPIMSVGGKGVVSVASNIIPVELLTLINYFKENKLKDAIELNKKLYPIFKNLFIDTNPGPLKLMLKLLNITKNDSVRLPLVEMSNQKNILILEELAKNINEVYKNFKNASV